MALAEALEKIRQGCTELDLRGNGIGAEGAKELAAVLTTNTALTELYLGGCGIGDEGAKELAAALTNNTALTELALRGNGIGNEGAKELAAALKTNTTLTELSLWSACSGAPPHPAAPPHTRTNARGVCGASPERSSHALVAPTARAPRVPQRMRSATRGPRSWPPRSRPTRPSPR